MQYKEAYNELLTQVLKDDGASVNTIEKAQDIHNSIEEEPPENDYMSMEEIQKMYPNDTGKRLELINKFHTGEAKADETVQAKEAQKDDAKHAGMSMQEIQKQYAKNPQERIRLIQKYHVGGNAE